MKSRMLCRATLIAGLMLPCGPLVFAEELVDYYHLDAFGNVRAVTNQAGQVIERHDYLPFGEECLTGPCASNPGAGAGQPLKFTGKERDTETGFDYFGARYYGSKIGRFTTVDPVYNWRENFLDPQRWNRYAYARNNPLRYVDPDGRDAIERAQGAYNAFVSDYFLLPFIRGDSGSEDFLAGQAYGDRLAFGVGVVQTVIGLTGGVGGTGLSLSGVGAVVGVPTIAMSAGVAAHGAGVTAVAGTYLSKNTSEGAQKPKFKKDFKTLEGAQDQAESIRAQKRLREKAGKRKIESTGKSDQAEQHQLDKIKSSADLPKNE